MGIVDHPPPTRGTGGKPITDEDKKRIKKAGEKADKIKEEKEKHHKEIDIPAAEDFLEKEMKKLS